MSKEKDLNWQLLWLFFKLCALTLAELHIYGFLAPIVTSLPLFLFVFETCRQQGVSNARAETLVRQQNVIFVCEFLPSRNH